MDSEVKKHGPRILDRIRRGHHILLISHERADGDSLGAALALAQYLDIQGKEVTHYTPTEISPYFSFLPRVEKLVYDINDDVLKKFDTIITLDCGSITQTCIPESLCTIRDDETAACLINIDHHASNDHFGNENLVMTTSSSTSEVVYKLLELEQASITRDMATCLLTGLITDTGNFTNGATTEDSLRIASELMKCGAQMKDITKHVIQNKNIASLQVWGKVLSRLEFVPEYKVAYTIIMQNDLQGEELPDGAVDGLTNFLNTLDNVDVIMVLKEDKDGHIKGSFRTTKPDVDVSAVAQKLGGGGHKKAAGFKFKGALLPTDAGWEIEQDIIR